MMPGLAASALMATRSLPEMRPPDGRAGSGTAVDRSRQRQGRWCRRSPGWSPRTSTHWSIRKTAGYPATCAARPIRIGREWLRQILHAHGISFQRTRTRKESRDLDKDAKLDRIEYVTGLFPDRCFALDQFGPLSIRPCHGPARAKRSRPDRLPATYRRTRGIRYFHGCYSLGDDKLRGVIRRRKGGDHSLAALKPIRAARPDGAPIYVIMDNLSASKTPAIRRWAAKNKVELRLTPANASWAHPRPSSGRCGPS
jgi:hypothetical protein